MGVETISAITLAVTDMARSVVFYRDHVGLEMLYGGEETAFTSFRVGDAYVNLILAMRDSRSGGGGSSSTSTTWTPTTVA